MQNRQNTRVSQVRTTTPRGAYTSYKNMNDRTTLIVLAALCLFVPPVGILLVWRAQHMDIPTRAIFSAAGFAATTLIFFLLMRPSAVVSNIVPTPATPQMIGYGAAATEAPAPVVPVAPAPGTAPAAPSAPSAPETPDTALQESGELTDDTIVYAVTNNASSYHLSQICGAQENHRSLTLRDALNEGLAPCQQCVGAKG